MIIEESIEIHAPLATVWRVFSRMEDWESWNTVCENCCLIEGDEMAAGTCFTFTLRPYRIPLKIAPRIVKCEPGKEVVWAGSRLGVHAEHRFTFEERGGRVVLTSVESFRGLMLWISRLVFVPAKLHRLTRKLLLAIKSQAESCGG
ncbi:SRPBCC family protein [Desulfococcus sp.]|uniref:SRPBCC family protein n=1 Tax=Desulfococcus sp. TaxID=2025834 RepID=UPI0035946692